MNKSIRNFLHSVRLRLHALVVLLIVAWAAYSAVALLLRSVFYPVQVPAQYLNRRADLIADSLARPTQPEDSESDLRAPMRHYHNVKRWFEPDPYNGCAVHDCHTSMAHNRTKAVRAFNNFHSTFVSCYFCHETPEQSTLAVSWVDTSTGTIRSTPPILELMRLLESKERQIKDNPQSLQKTMVLLLTTINQKNTPDAVLDYLLIQIDSSQPGSPVWEHALDQLNAELPQHARGEYAAKIVPQDTAQTYRRRGEQLQQWAQQYLAAPENSPEREGLDQQIHERLVEVPRSCLDCHSAERLLVDFQALGYSEKRTALLRNSSLARQMEKIQSGEQYLLSPHPGERP